MQIILATLLLLAGLPAAGMILAGGIPGAYLEFPPVTRYIVHAPFSRIAFMVIAGAAGMTLLPFLMRYLKFPPAPDRERRISRRPFPAWGYGGLALLAVSWALAWLRFDFSPMIQRHTFTPLWISYIILVNALTWKRTGESMMTHRKGKFLALFPASALFWWSFEYLNRFVQNWHYSGTGTESPLEYFILATIPFSTVLPAVLGTRDLILSFEGIMAPFRSWVRITPRGRGAAVITLIFFSAGLILLPLYPDILFPILWLAPAAIMVSLQALRGDVHPFSTVARGDWSVPLASALSALMAGFFWEMWNYGSLARWEYSIPWVQRFLVFEMPLLGYAGYLPFGIECAIIGDMVMRKG